MIEIKINENDGGQRLDRFLRKYLPGSPLSLVYRMIRKDVKVNGRRAAKETMLEAGDVVRLYIPEEKLAELGRSKKAPKVRKTFGIAYEDGNVLIAEKPYGILTHGDSKEKKNTLANQVLGYLAGEGAYEASSEHTFTPAPLNRLDRNTTGLVIFAKNAPAAREISAMLREKTGVRKIYRTIVRGRLEEETVLDGSLEKDEKKNIVKVSGEADAKRSVTIVRPLKTDRTGSYSLVEAELVTGRTHQIRVHLSQAGLPLVGDPKYGDPETNAYFKRKYGLTSQLLHAERLEFAGASEDSAGAAADEAGSPDAVRLLAGKTVRAKTPKMFRQIEKDLFG